METEMQKLVGRDTYTPVDIPHVHCSVAGRLNKSARVGLVSSSLKTPSNNSDAALTCGQGVHSILVYVLNKQGKPLMPCKPQKAKQLLKTGKAVVVRRTPFTIRLRQGVSGYRQQITLGVDSGYISVGLSAVTDKQEVYVADVGLRRDIVKLNLERRTYRRARRGRKTWHRKPRFLNRKKAEGWLAPSLQHKIDSHLRLVEKVKEMLPVTRVIMEVASFDSQKMQNPEITGIEYQQGELQGYEVREYLWEKWKRQCAYCNKKDVPLEVEHITPRSRGGSDRVSNLTISCRECNLEKGNQTAEEFGFHKIQKQAEKSLKATPFMNVVRSRIVGKLECEITYGYQTKKRRIQYGLEKNHRNDAYVIAGGSSQTRLTSQLRIKQVRRCNRKLHNGIRSHIKNTAPRFVYGFQRYDKVRYGKVECFINGRRTSGYFDLKKLDGTKIHASAKYSDLTLLETRNTYLMEVEGNPSLPYLTARMGSLLAQTR